MTFKQVGVIAFEWIIFPIVFTCWYFDCKWSGLSDGLAEDYRFYNNVNYKEVKGEKEQ